MISSQRSSISLHKCGLAVPRPAHVYSTRSSGLATLSTTRLQMCAWSCDRHSLTPASRRTRTGGPIAYKTSSTTPAGGSTDSNAGRRSSANSQRRRSGRSRTPRSLAPWIGRRTPTGTMSQRLLSAGSSEPRRRTRAPCSGDRRRKASTQHSLASLKRCTAAGMSGRKA